MPGNTTEACDDGNSAGGDGCAADCTVEPGYMCAPAGNASGDLVLSIVYRDMIKRQDPGGHPNFEVTPMPMPMLVPGIVGPLGAPLDAQGKPAYAAVATTDTHQCLERLDHERHRFLVLVPRLGLLKNPRRYP